MTAEIDDIYTYLWFLDDKKECLYFTRSFVKDKFSKNQSFQLSVMNFHLASPHFFTTLNNSSEKHNSGLKGVSRCLV